jgi:membrane protein
MKLDLRRRGASLNEWIWGQDLEHLSRPRRAFVFIGRLIYLLVRELSSGSVSLWAMSLVYTTLLSLVPLLAVSFSLLTAFGVHNELEPFLHEIFAPLGPGAEQVVDNIVEFIDNTRVGVLGAVGVVTLIYLVVSLVQKTEEAFNYIWQIQSLRRIPQRVADYLSVIVIGPVLIVSAIGLYGTIMATDLMERLAEIEPFGTFLWLIGALLPHLLIAGAFALVYLLIPNTKVRVGAAAAGGFFAGMAWQATGWIFAIFIATSARYEAIYSGFAIVILLMFWLYVSWLVLLLGAQVAFYVQYPRLITRMREPNLVLSARVKERLALSAMYLITEHYYRGGDGWRMEALANRLGLPVEPVRETVRLLEAKGLIVESADDPPAYYPRRDPESVQVREFLESIRAAGEESMPQGSGLASTPQVDTLLGRVEAAKSQALGEQTFKGLVLAGGQDNPGSGAPHGQTEGARMKSAEESRRMRHND